MAVLFWLGLLVVTTFIFYLLWKFATRIELQEQEENQWKQWVEEMQYYDPYNHYYYQQLFDERFYT